MTPKLDASTLLKGTNCHADTMADSLVVPVLSESPIPLAITACTP